MRAMAKRKPKQASNTIALNKRARFDYHLTERFEAGIALVGWEVKPQVGTDNPRLVGAFSSSNVRKSHRQNN